MELTTEDGTVLTVEREEGDPEVGDNASPDGTWLMPDGKTITVEGGVITEITKAEPETEPETDAEVATLKQQVADLTATLKIANDTIDNLKASKMSNADKDTLNKVAALGGIERLRTMASTYVPAARQNMPNTINKKIAAIAGANAQKRDPFLDKINKLKEGGNK
jgi:ATP-dependent Clp protease protease subunit